MPQAEFFFGAMSPYSWFAAERVEALLGPVRWTPIFAGGLFKQRGTTSWGLTDERAAKLADCEARAAQHGLGPITWPEPWPTLDLLIARALAHAARLDKARELGLAAMRLAFLEGGDLDRPDVVEEAVGRAGLDVAAVISAVETDAIKTAVRAATAEAYARGVRGIPTTIVAGRLFFGDDQLAAAAAAQAQATHAPR